MDLPPYDTQLSFYAHDTNCSELTEIYAWHIHFCLQATLSFLILSS